MQNVIWKVFFHIFFVVYARTQRKAQKTKEISDVEVQNFKTLGKLCGQTKVQEALCCSSQPSSCFLVRIRACIS